MRYDPWGKERYAQYTTPSGYRYTSQRWDSGLELYDYNARYYDPTLGKFISADTLVPEPSSPQAFNRYAYTLGNPLRYTDPTGHLTEEEIQDYFDFSDKQDARDLNWAEDLINWLWDDAVTWGDVFTYDAGEAMLVLFEAVKQDSGLYHGGFWGLNGDNRGEEVHAYEITFVDDHTEKATNLESIYEENWHFLPRKTGSDGYNNYDPTNYVNVLTVSNGGTIASLAGLLFLGGPIAATVTILGGVFAVTGLVTDTLTEPYPVLRLPSHWGNAPTSYFFGRPQGVNHR